MKPSLKSAPLWTFLFALFALILNAGCNHDNDDCPNCSNGHCPNGQCPAPQSSGAVSATAMIPATIQPVTPAPAAEAAPATPPPVSVQAAPAGPGVKRAVIVGINKFLDPGAPPLTGCVPDAARIYAKATGNAQAAVACFGAEADAKMIAKCATNGWGFDPANVTCLLNEQATVANVKAALAAAVAASKPGDTLLYWQSSHGTEDTIPDDNGAAVHGMVCCYDFAWDREHELCDVDFKAMFSKLPSGVMFNWGSDSCNSGDLDRNVQHHKHPVRPKAVTQPPRIRQRVRAARLEGAKTKGIINGELDVGFLPGCKADQTSADSEDDDGYPGGALTVMFMKEVDAFAGKPLTALAKQMDTDLAQDGYDQVCVPDGARKVKPWLGN